MLLIEKMRMAEGFTALERQITEFILSNSERFFEMTMAELTKSLYVSKATVIRYFKKLVYDSYREFCVELAKEMNLIQAGRKLTGSSLNECESVNDISVQIQKVMKNAIEISASFLNEKDIQEIASAMARSKRILLYGFGPGGKPASEYLFTKLIRIGKDVSNIGYESVFVDRYRADADDVCALFLVYNDSEGNIAPIARSLKEKSIRTYMICGPYQNDIDRVVNRVARTMYPESADSVFHTVGSAAAMQFVAMVIYYTVTKITASGM